MQDKTPKGRKAKGNLHSLGSHLPPVPATNPIRPTSVTRHVNAMNHISPKAQAIIRRLRKNPKGN